MEIGTTPKSSNVNDVTPMPDMGGYGSDLLSPRPRSQAWTELLLVGGGCFLMAAILRFIRIGYREYFGSEFATLDILGGHRPGNFIMAFLRGDVSIYYMLLWGWSRATGWASEGLLRLPSAVIGLGAWVAFLLFVRSYLRGTAFVICLLMFALNPILVASSIDASPFALLSLCVVVANHMAVRSLDQGGRMNWIGYGLSMVMGIAAHPLFWFVLLAHFLFAVVRGRRTPKPFRDFCWAMLGVCLFLAVLASIFGSRYFERAAGLQAPSAADFMRNLVAIAIGDFPRFGANEFARAIMYLFVLSCLAFSYIYYRKRTAEAKALPDNVVWIDDTQDVVGTWRNFSLRGFLLFQWVTFAVPALCVIIMGSLFSGFVPQPYMFIVSLPPLIVLIAMGIDAAPRSATTAMGVLLVLGMAYYNVCALSDRGYGIEEAFKIIRAHSFDPSHDVIVYTAPDNIERTINHYRGDLTLVPVPVANKRPEVLERQQLVSKLTQGKDRAIVIYQNDGRPIGRMDNISPLRDWFNNQNNNWDLTDKWYLTNLEPINRTELRIFKFKKPETNDSVTSAPAN